MFKQARLRQGIKPQTYKNDYVLFSNCEPGRINHGEFKWSGFDDKR